MQSAIIHCDMDAFYASVEARDNADLAGKPLIVGALPGERGVVATCSYEARKYGVRSAMSVKEAYRLCPQAVFIRPDFRKYKEVSSQIREIWGSYTDLVEPVSLDEGYLDVSRSMHLFGGAVNIGRGIKEKIKSKTGLTCSVGIGYSMMSAKIASEEKKPDGFFEIPTPEFLKNLIIGRSVRIIYGIGAKTAEELEKAGIRTVGDIYNNKQTVIGLLGNHGRQIIDLSEGIDARSVASCPKSRSLGKEHTFQQDISDFDYLKDVLRLCAKQLSYQLKLTRAYCRTVTLKVTYADMKKITRSKSGGAINDAADIYKAAAAMLDEINKRPVRLLGITLSGFTQTAHKQMSLMDSPAIDERNERLDNTLMGLRQKFGFGIIKTGSELSAEKRLFTDKNE